MVSKLMLTLELLRDGKWHGTDELLRRLDLDEDKLQEIIAFLSSYGFVEVGKKDGKVRINKDVQKLIAQNAT